MTASFVAADGGVGAGKADDRVFFLHVAADQLVGLADPDDFLHARHLVESAGFDLRLVAGDADGGALRTRHGMSAIAECLDFFAYRAYLLLGGVRLHDDKHGNPLVILQCIVVQRAGATKMSEWQFLLVGRLEPIECG